MEPETKLKPGDQVLFVGTRYTLLEREFEKEGQEPIWLCCETDNAYAEPKFIVEADLRKWGK